MWMCFPTVCLSEQAVERLLDPADGTTGGVAAATFSSPDITAALDIKEYYCQLAESLQVQHTVTERTQTCHEEPKALL